MGVMGIRAMVSRSSNVRFVHSCNLPVHVVQPLSVECTILSTCNVDQFIQFTISSSSVKKFIFILYTCSCTVYNIIMKLFIYTLLHLITFNATHSLSFLSLNRPLLVVVDCTRYQKMASTLRSTMVTHGVVLFLL